MNNSNKNTPGAGKEDQRLYFLKILYSQRQDFIDQRYQLAARDSSYILPSRIRIDPRLDT